MENCVIYARFSSHGQNEQSIEAQVRICKKYAENKGFDVVNLYTDKAKTGTNDARPAFQKMIADAKTGAFQYIIVYMFDRFARNRRDSIMYKEMLKDKYGVKVISALEPIAEDEGGEFYEMFLEWNAEKYSKRLSKRVRDGLDTSIANGTFCGGFIIYGYKLELDPVPGKQGKFTKRIVVNEEEAKVMRYVFEQYDKGVSKKQIAADLNAQGIRVKGKLITHKTFDTYIKNTKYTGEFYFGNRLCTNMYPAIIDKEIFERVQQRLTENRYFLGGKETAKKPYLLTGKLFCGHCGTEMVSGGGKSRTGKQYYYYECKKKKKKLCDKRIEHKDKLEKYVVQKVIEFLSNEVNLKVIAQDVLKYFDSRTDESEIKSIRKRIADIQEEADAAANAFIEAKSPLLKQRIEKRMQECEVLLADLEKIKARLVVERGQKLTEQDIVSFVNMILQGDVEDIEFRRRLIDNLVYKVYVSDDDTFIYFNIKGGNHIEEITLEDTKAALKESHKVLTQRDPACQNYSSPQREIALRGSFWRFSLKKPPVILGDDKNTLVNKNLYVIISEGLATASLKITGGFYQMKNEIKHTAHSTYRCEYHIVFAPKYRRKEIYGQLKKDIGEIIRKLCNEKKVEIIEAEACADHIHMLISVPPYLSIAQFMGFLKGKSTLMIYDRHANLKYKYGSRSFWCRGYYVDTVGRNERVIQEYIKKQLEEDHIHDQISISEYIDPFTGIKNK